MQIRSTPNTTGAEAEIVGYALYIELMFQTAALRYIPNALSVARILLTPVVLLLLASPTLTGQAAALVCFMLAGASDYYDGVLARRMKARSRLGQFLDPLADKILVLGIFIALVFLEPDVLTGWGVALIALRDLVVTVVRSYAESQGRTLKTLRLAKGKTLFQLAFLFGILLLRTLAEMPSTAETARGLLSKSTGPLLVFYAVVAFTVFTGLLYVLQPREDIV